VIRFPQTYREPPPPEREQLELWPDLPATPVRNTPARLIAEIEEECAAIFHEFAAIGEHLDAIRVGFALLAESEGEQ
jgi:hypothetical protein